MLEHDFGALDHYLNHLINRLSVREREQLLRKVGQSLRRNNQQRNRAQQNPDGSAWTTRQARTHRPQRMMRKIHAAHRLRLQVDAEQLRLGYQGRDAFIARIHHFGQGQQLEYGFVRYPARELLGISGQDRAWILESIMQQLVGD